MERIVDELSDLGQGQVARLTIDEDEDEEVEARVNQISYTPDEYLRLELTGDEERYQVRSRFEDGEWTSPELRRRDRSEWDWEPVGQVTAVAPGETFRTMKSTDMEAQEDSGASQ